MRTVASSSGHGKTLNRLLDAIERRGLTLFAQIGAFIAPAQRNRPLWVMTAHPGLTEHAGRSAP
jgi:hypothetical protein